jgi:hypothetical protein
LILPFWRSLTLFITIKETKSSVKLLTQSPLAPYSPFALSVSWFCL